MPYITEAQRDRILANPGDSQNPGELNYELTLICQAYLFNTKHSYQNYNDVIGALEACKLEFYRRLVSPYEDKKITENGDVYL